MQNLKKTSALTPDEVIILEKKYASKKFKYLDPIEQILAVKTLLLKIHVITGWVLPGAELKNILNDQFHKKIMEEYSELNPDEIEYAFRNKGTGLEDWGKEVNLNLLDKILIPYLDARFAISQNEERLLPVSESIPWNKEDFINKYRSEIEAAFQAMKKGYNPIIHIYFEETLREDGMMLEAENIHEFLVRKLGSNCDNLYVKEN